MDTLDRIATALEKIAAAFDHVVTIENKEGGTITIHQQFGADDVGEYEIEGFEDE